MFMFLLYMIKNAAACSIGNCPCLKECEYFCLLDAYLYMFQCALAAIVVAAVMGLVRIILIPCHDYFSYTCF